MALRRARLAAARRPVRPAPRVGGPRAPAPVTRRHPVTPDAGFVALPAPRGQPPYRRALAEVIGSERTAAIARAGAVRFHCVGDTGGDTDPRPQRRVAAAMVAELDADPPASFFYHLGDVVYPHGEESNYRSQFHAPYAAYTAPILAIPGNHDAESPIGSGGSTLDPFVDTFGRPAPRLRDAAIAPPRPPAAQPHVHWTLVHDWVRIVGLYSNVPEGGRLADDQLGWLIGELHAAPAAVTLIVAVHQPVYSADITHGSNLSLADVLDDCAGQAGRAPDAVLSGHSHSYQRFTRRVDGREIPYVVAGAGGCPELHELDNRVGALPASFQGLDGVTLDACEDRAHGFLTVTARPGGAEVVYSAVTAEKVAPVDRFAITPLAAA